MISVTEVSKDMIPRVWSALAPEIEKAMSSGQGDECTPETIAASLGAGLSEMWAIHDQTRLMGCVVIAIEQSSTRKVWVDLLAGFEMDTWVGKLEEVLKAYAEQVGASCVEASCRPGLARNLEKRGWRKKAVIMEIKSHV